jgi:hypothetical protein
MQIAKMASIRTIVLIGTNVRFLTRNRTRGLIRAVSRIEAVFAICTDRALSALFRCGAPAGARMKCVWILICLWLDSIRRRACTSNASDDDDDDDDASFFFISGIGEKDVDGCAKKK